MNRRRLLKTGQGDGRRNRCWHRCRHGLRICSETVRFWQALFILAIFVISPDRLIFYFFAGGTHFAAHTRLLLQNVAR